MAVYSYSLVVLASRLSYENPEKPNPSTGALAGGKMAGEALRCWGFDFQTDCAFISSGVIITTTVVKIRVLNH